MNVEVLLCVYRKAWTRSGGVDLKAVDWCTFVFYFEEVVELELVLKKSPYSFDDCLLAVQRLLPSMSPCTLAFDSTPVWVQIHDLTIDWRIDTIIRRIVRFVESVIEIDKFSISGGLMRIVRVRGCFDLAKAMVPGA